MQPVCPIPIPCYRNIIQTGMYSQLSEFNRIGNLPPDQPALILYPWVRHLLLKLVFKLLLKQSHVIIESNASAIYPQPCHGIQKAGRQTP